MKRLFLAFLFGTLLIGEPHLGKLRVQSGLETVTVPTPAELALQSLGEIRYTLAAYLWLQAEIYHHELGLFMGSQPEAPGSGQARKIGEILAICRVVTRLDPNFVQAYDVGYWRLAKSLGQVNQGLSFLREGLKNNPDSPILNDDMADLYFLLLKDCKDALPYLEAGVRLNRDKTAVGKDLRILGLCYQKENQKPQAVRTFRKLLVLFPDDPFARSHLKRLEK